MKLPLTIFVVLCCIVAICSKPSPEHEDKDNPRSSSEESSAEAENPILLTSEFYEVLPLSEFLTMQ